MMRWSSTAVLPEMLRKKWGLGELIGQGLIEDGRLEPADVFKPDEGETHDALVERPRRTLSKNPGL